MQTSRIASFACTALMGTNKAGILRPNADAAAARGGADAAKDRMW